MAEAPGAHARLEDATVRLFGARRLDDAPHDVPVGTIVGQREGAVGVSARGGLLRVDRVRPDAGEHAGKKVAAAQVLDVGDRLT